MWTPGIWELVLILVIVLVVFGTGKLSDIGSSLGTAIRDFKASVKEPPAAPAEPDSDKKDDETV
ncbi:MAG TPA: twin-arginine translocase TatA/TatE family subunit [Candidatus Hydrogenedentes bacterium]|mgnify:FL=1|jgi:sec-independent protein translocase protein TatA|nr:twin-arginine translocase TatA/TatE family subunit [Candidatus Hydrogenedentota bacterium]